MIAQLSMFDVPVQDVEPVVALHPVERSTLTFTTTKIKPELLEMLKGFKVIPLDGIYAVESIPQMDQSLYQKQFKPLIEALRGEWTGKIHRFEYDPTLRVQEIIKAGKLPQINPYALFETPDSEIDDLFDLIDLPEFSDYPYRILEPNGGTGKIALKLRDRLPNSIIDVCEIDPFNQDILEAHGFNLIGSDWLKTFPKEKYDYCVMNPPFQGDVYIDHIIKALHSLRIGGRLGAIAPSSLLWSDSTKAQELRNLVASTGYWENISSPFKKTKVECLSLRIENQSLKDLQHNWEPNSGYPSTYALNLDIALSCDRKWYDASRSILRSDDEREVEEGAIAKLLDDTVKRLVGKEGYCLYYDARVKNQIVECYLNDDEI